MIHCFDRPIKALILALIVFSPFENTCKNVVPSDEEEVVDDLISMGGSVWVIDGEKSLRRLHDDQSFKKNEKIFVDLFDCSSICECLECVKKLGETRVLLIGNSSANLSLNCLLEKLVDCQSVETFLFDSVDSDDVSVAHIRKSLPNAQIIFLERAAIRLVDQSYRFALVAPESSSFDLAVNPKHKDFQYLDADLFMQPVRFVGKNWYPIPIAPLPKDALKYFRHFRNLKNVCLDGIDVDDKDLKFLRQSQGLEVVSLQETKVTELGLLELATENITELHLLGITSVKEIPFHKLPNLKVIRVDTIESKTILDQLRQCKSIVCIITNELVLTEENAVSLLDALPRLETLQIKGIRISAESETSVLQEIRDLYPDVKIIESKEKMKENGEKPR